jgi:hypothetical protein
MIRVRETRTKICSPVQIILLVTKEEKKEGRKEGRKEKSDRKK